MMLDSVLTVIIGSTNLFLKEKSADFVELLNNLNNNNNTRKGKNSCLRQGQQVWDENRIESRNKDIRTC